MMLTDREDIQIAFDAINPDILLRILLKIF